MTRRYEHDCLTCVFICRRDEFDAYYHKRQLSGLVELILRRSNEPSDYSSMSIHAFEANARDLYKQTGDQLQQLANYYKPFGYVLQLYRTMTEKS